jgi:hypothetical protein
MRALTLLLSILPLTGCWQSFTPREYQQTQAAAWAMYYANQKPTFVMEGYTCATPLTPEKCRVEIRDRPVAPQIAQGRGPVEALEAMTDFGKALILPGVAGAVAVKALDGMHGPVNINASGDVRYQQDMNTVFSQRGDGTFGELSLDGRVDNTHPAQVVNQQEVIPVYPGTVEPSVHVIEPSVHVIEPYPVPTTVVPPAWIPEYLVPAGPAQ